METSLGPLSSAPESVQESRLHKSLNWDRKTVSERHRVSNTKVVVVVVVVVPFLCFDKSDCQLEIVFLWRQGLCSLS